MTAHWMARARCRDYPPEVMDMTRGDYAVAKAKAICAHCSVIAKCRAYVDEMELNGKGRGLNPSVIDCIYACETPHDRVARRKGAHAFLDRIVVDGRAYVRATDVAEYFNVTNKQLQSCVRYTRGLHVINRNNRRYITENILSHTWQEENLSEYWKRRLGIKTPWRAFKDVFGYMPREIGINDLEGRFLPLVESGAVKRNHNRTYVNVEHVTRDVLALIRKQCELHNKPFMYMKEVSVDDYRAA